MSDFKFNWNEVVSVKGKSGIYIMMTYAKVRSIFRTMGIDPESEHLTFDYPSFESEENEIIQSCVVDLMITLANYENVLFESYEALDAFILKEYIYELCKALTRLHNTAPCVSEPCFKKQSNRLVAFQCGILVLKHALHVIGVTPLDKI